MKIVGVICEYNPFHLGHRKQLEAIRRELGPDCGIVCLMSGDFVQRGMPAIFPKALRAQAALECGADLVLENPVQYALQSAEGFAAGGVRILSPFCTHLSFGSECGRQEEILATAGALLSPDFPEKLRRALDQGLSFPAARQAALGASGAILGNPNDILAVEYCKAILAQSSPLIPHVITREGSYHDAVPDRENPSATGVRNRILAGDSWQEFLPAAAVFENAPIHTLSAGERAVLARLRTMTEAEFAALPFGSEGLWRKFMHACREKATLEEIIAATKSKRYTRSRIDRMVLCAFLGLTEEMLAGAPPYTRVLGLNETGRGILKLARQTGFFPHIGEKTDSPQWALEQRCSDLYGLFRTDAPAPAGNASRERVQIL